ncbi:MAG TPA: DUF1918 domain-containing protein [Pedococcus sp.]|jgi:hypothetical protein
MKAQVGDRIVLAGEQVDRPTRDGEVLEVRGANGEPPYLVRWSDGHTGLLYPGPGSVLRIGAAHGTEAPATPAPRPVKEWQVRVSIFETGDDTTAKVVLVADSPDTLNASGESHRSDDDEPATRIGDEVAVARALRHLADELLDAATKDIETSTGEVDVFVRPR